MTAENTIIIDALRILHDVSKALNSTLDIGRLEDMILNKTVLLMKSTKALLLILDKNKQTLNIHNSLGFATSELPQVRFEHIQSFNHCIVHKGGVITLEEILCDHDRLLLEKAYPQLLKMIFAPLEVQGEAYGLLGIDDSTKDISKITLEIFCSLAAQAAAAMENANLYARLHSTFLHTAEALAEAINSRDPYTGGHTKRVRSYALQLAEALALDKEDKNTLRLAAILHDIGKIGVDDAILRKIGRLTYEEQQKMKNHPRIGARILGYVEEMKEVIPGVLHHHEWYDGSGYPDGLAGEEIPLQARIVAIADAFDALTTNRPYRRASSTAEALDILDMGCGSHLDPGLLKIFRTLQIDLQSGV